MPPPGQRLAKGWPVSHYGPVPRFRPDRWNLQVFGATATRQTYSWTFDEVLTMPRATVLADLHCASGTSTLGHEFFGVPASTLLDLAPPAPGVSHVMAWAEYGYSANLRLSDFTADSTIMATHHDGEPLTLEHGFPLRPLLRTKLSGSANRAISQLPGPVQQFALGQAGAQPVVVEAGS
ncbi:molybdopterin-dependent oxidoreductase [Streptomyces netropsis]|uniref:DMSO/TMAO reductase YedYZ molybdopterin-dependent catalytic subunit n=1 Tax=Streptomyces netropsis TaxID=55404 RepID=A0A7W7PFT1_STRNE|nr:molybdopterin-dependent oxidoreductase [Streptomyces netropsis]MBB4887493.1 DMSO/TMAO reductase YedYZ molybdopterin-dependent catalytic subunit [Streptomyces netropsis]GGR10755.1 hypothetical protein GCM10010219_14350 [Streptomyces netropsis]